MCSGHALMFLWTEIGDLQVLQMDVIDELMRGSFGFAGMFMSLRRFSRSLPSQLMI